MRTKTLILAAAITTAGLATSMAQTTVYSVNTVGYVNLTIPAGFSIIGNPLKAGNNTVTNLFGAAPVTGGLPANSIIYKFDASAASPYSINRFRNSGWSIPDQTVVPGEGFFIFNAGTTAVTNIFVGEVQQGTNVVNLPSGFSIVASTVPQAGGVVSALGLAPTANDQVYQFDVANQTYFSAKLFRASGTWSGGEPVIAVGEGFFFNNASAAKTWTRVFTTGT